MVGFSKEGTQTGTSSAPEQHSSANQHLSPELQLGTIFDPRKTTHTEDKRPLCSTVASDSFYIQKVLGLRRLWSHSSPMRPVTAIEINYAAE